VSAIFSGSDAYVAMCTLHDHLSRWEKTSLLYCSSSQGWNIKTSQR